MKCLIWGNMFILACCWSPLMSYPSDHYSFRDSRKVENQENKMTMTMMPPMILTQMETVMMMASHQPSCKNLNSISRSCLCAFSLTSIDVYSVMGYFCRKSEWISMFVCFPHSCIYPVWLENTACFICSWSQYFYYFYVIMMKKIYWWTLMCILLVSVRMYLLTFMVMGTHGNKRFFAGISFYLWHGVNSAGRPRIFYFVQM